MHTILLLSRSKVLRDNTSMYVAHVCFYVCCSESAGVCGDVVVYRGLLKVVGFISCCEVFCVVDVMGICSWIALDVNVRSLSSYVKSRKTTGIIVKFDS